MVFLSEIVGNQYRGIDAQVRYSRLEAGEEMKLVREPTNEYDPNAIQIHTMDDVFLGFIPKHRAKKLAPLLDVGKLYSCTVGETQDLVIEFSDEQDFVSTLGDESSQ